MPRTVQLCGAFYLQEGCSLGQDSVAGFFLEVICELAHRTARITKVDLAVFGCVQDTFEAILVSTVLAGCRITESQLSQQLVLECAGVTLREQLLFDAVLQDAGSIAGTIRCKCRDLV